MKSIYSSVVLVLVVLVIACQEKAMNPAIPEGPDFSVTPMENREAELTALHLSGELIAPVWLYGRVKSELEQIRRQWSDSIGSVKLEFQTNYKESIVLMRSNHFVFDSITSGTYNHWDSLNNYYPFESVSTYLNLPDKIYFALKFKGRLNSYLLSKEYSGLPGIALAGWQSRLPGDSPMLIPLKDRHVIKYFFRNGYGDCPSGCMYSDIYYFSSSRGEISYHGFYSSEFPEIGPVPTWLDTFRLAFHQYLYFNQE